MKNVFVFSACRKTLDALPLAGKIHIRDRKGSPYILWRVGDQSLDIFKMSVIGNQSGSCIKGGGGNPEIIGGNGGTARLECCHKLAVVFSHRGRDRYQSHPWLV